MTLDREKIVVAMAQAAHDAHYCPWRGDHGKCENCRADGRCFELSASGPIEDDVEWMASGRAALEAFEAVTGIKVGE